MGFACRWSIGQELHSSWAISSSSSMPFSCSSSLPRRPSLAPASPRRPSLALVRAPRGPRARTSPLPPTFQAREQMKRKKEDDEDEGITLDEDSWDDSEETAVVKIYNSPVEKRTKVAKGEVINGLAEMLEKSVIEEDKRERETDLVKEINKLALTELTSKANVEVNGVKKRSKEVELRILEMRRKSRRPMNKHNSKNLVSIAKAAPQLKSTSSLIPAGFITARELMSKRFHQYNKF